MSQRGCGADGSQRTSGQSPARATVIGLPAQPRGAEELILIALAARTLGTPGRRITAPCASGLRDRWSHRQVVDRGRFRRESSTGARTIPRRRSDAELNAGCRGGTECKSHRQRAVFSYADRRTGVAERRGRVLAYFHAMPGSVPFRLIGGGASKPVAATERAIASSIRRSSAGDGLVLRQSNMTRVPPLGSMRMSITTPMALTVPPAGSSHDR